MCKVRFSVTIWMTLFLKTREEGVTEREECSRETMKIV
jgi:hypothetical protein